MAISFLIPTAILIVLCCLDCRRKHLGRSQPCEQVRSTPGFSICGIHGEGYRADEDGGLWEKNLPPGEYRLVLTSNQNPGTAAIYLQIP